MPTLTRMVLVLALIAAAIYGTMLALVAFVDPVQTEIIIKIPAKDLNPVMLHRPLPPVEKDETPEETE